MRFGDFPVDEAESLILAHSIRANGQAMKKGRVLSRSDVAVLTEAGISTVTGALLDPDDVPEDAAAGQVAEAACGPGLSCGKPFTGRCNLFAEEAGLAILDSQRIDQINLLDESMTVGTLAPYSAVQPGQMVGTIKVIPFAATRDVVEQCSGIAASPGPLVRIAPWKDLRISLVQSRLAGTKETVLDSTTAVVRTRLAALGNDIAAETRCAHEQSEVAAAIRTHLDGGSDIILIAGASAIVDRRDVIPAAITDTDGEIDHFGMPVDPGNLLLMAHHGEQHILGLPGCARSIKLNGFDWVLQRLIAGVPVTRRDVMLMGAGGLLMEIPTRPMPRAKASPQKTPTSGTKKMPIGTAPKIASIVLAAGQSRRMGSLNKLLQRVDGRSMIVHAIEAAIQSGADPVIVVTGYEADEIRDALKNHAVTFVHNPHYDDGMSTSLRAGISALSPDIDGALVCLADMPKVDAPVLRSLIDAFDPSQGRSIGVPTSHRKRGNPILWAARFFPEMMLLAGDVGARHLIGEHAEDVYEVETGHAVVTDIDTPEALANLTSDT